MNKEGLENLTPSGPKEVKRHISKQQVSYLIHLCKWMSEKGVGIIVK